MKKIQRYDMCVEAYLDEEDVENTGDYLHVSDLIEFARQFSKDHVVRTTLLEALGEQDAT